MTDRTTIRRTCGCGATITDAGGWCTLCFATCPEPAVIVLDERFVSAPFPSHARPVRPPVDARPPVPERGPCGRWDATDLTFSFRGRLIATVLLALPLAWFIMSAGPAFGLLGVITYGYYLRIGLRDIWRRADRL